VLFAVAAVVESLSADTVLPIIAFFGAVSVGVYHALRAPSNAARLSQIDEADQHIAWLNRTLTDTRNRLGRAIAKLSENGIEYEDIFDSNPDIEREKTDEAKDDDQDTARQGG
jgi:hypothetical protein